jgi:hypothetical protein
MKTTKQTVGRLCREVCRDWEGEVVAFCESPSLKKNGGYGSEYLRRRMRDTMHRLNWHSALNTIEEMPVQ